jgi:hypothetical protein
MKKLLIGIFLSVLLAVVYILGAYQGLKSSKETVIISIASVKLLKAIDYKREEMIIKDLTKIYSELPKEVQNKLIDHLKEIKKTFKQFTENYKKLEPYMKKNDEIQAMGNITRKKLGMVVAKTIMDYTELILLERSFLRKLLIFFKATI